MANEEFLKIKKAMIDINNLAVSHIENGPYENDMPGMELAVKIDKISKVFCTAEDHIPDTTKMMPLTLEQLRQMDGKCVKVVVDGVEYLEMLVLVEVPKDEDCVLLRNNLGGVSEFYNDDDLRENGVKAYAYPPSHIDLEAWEPCEECGKRNCDNCLYSEYLSNMEPCKSCYNAKEWKPLHGFCGNCGRPLKPDARAMLEKRLRGEH